uniref:Uncharacterized protein n=1 Tax=Amphiprion ocellaris TaxID=80972 RepID=A0AAQ6AI28_AMPOC
MNQKYSLDIVNMVNDDSLLRYLSPMHGWLGHTKNIRKAYLKVCYGFRGREMLGIVPQMFLRSETLHTHMEHIKLSCRSGRRTEKNFTAGRNKNINQTELYFLFIPISFVVSAGKKFKGSNSRSGIQLSHRSQRDSTQLVKNAIYTLNLIYAVKCILYKNIKALYSKVGN